MFLPGVPCAPCCTCPAPCPNLEADCLEVTFSGFSHGTGNCHECDFLDDGTYVLKRLGTGEFSLAGYIADTKGSGAAVDVAFAQDKKDGSYTITGVTLTAPGSGYTQDARFEYILTRGLVDCDGESQPEVNVVVGVVAPVLTATVTGGFGASLSVSISPVNETEGEETWGVSAVGVTSPGSGYTDGASVTFSDNKATQVAAASATINVVRNEPFIYASLDGSGGGFAEATLQLTEQTIDGQKWYTVTGATLEFQFGGFSVDDTATLFLPSGTVTRGGIAAVVKVAAVDEDGAITSLAVTTEGSYYQTNGAIESVTVASPGEYYRGGGIQSVTLIDGGKFWRNNPCEYVWIGCPICPDSYTSTFGSQITRMEVRFIAGPTTHILLVRRNVTSFSSTGLGFTVEAERYATANKPHDGSEWGESGFAFEPEYFVADFGQPETQCLNTGTATVRKIECDAETDTACDIGDEMPTQITFSLSGMGRLFLWSSLGGGSPGVSGCPEGSPAHGGEYETFCGLCDGPPDAFLRQGGSAIGFGGYVGSLITQDFTAVLDLEEPAVCGGWVYRGPLPATPEESGNPFSGTTVSCNEGEIAADNAVSVSISPIDVSTSVTLDGPQWGDQDAVVAEAEATIAGGSITAITVTNPGFGYAREIFERVAPTVTATSESTGGTNATLSVTLEQFTPGYGEGSVWTVQSVAVTSGGTGYTGLEPLVFSAAEGDTTEWEAFGEIVTGREEPTVSAEVYSGSGAELSVTLSQTTDFDGRDVWEVASVSVADGGTEYTDGESVTFSAGDGVEVWPASATIVVGRAEPEVTLSLSMTSSGFGAQLSATLSKDQDFSGRDYWYVSKITVDSPGVGYENGESVFASTFDVENNSLSATVNTRNEEPDVTVQWQLGEGSTGNGAIFGVTLSPTTDEEGKDVWGISAVTVISAGENFLETDILAVAVNAGTEIIPAEFDFELNETGGFASVTVTEGGRYAIVGLIDTVDILYGGEYFRSTGVVESVTLIDGGTYYKSTGSIESILLYEGGFYYREQTTGEAEVQTPQVLIGSYSGFGATATATVDGTLGSATFGQVTSISVDSGGERYFSGGAGWLLSVGMGLAHLQTALSAPPETSSVNPESCLNFSDRIGLIHPRVSIDPCPSELLNKTYPMMISGIPDPFFQRLPEGFADYCVIPGGPGSSDQLRIFGFASPIEVTIS